MSLIVDLFTHQPAFYLATIFILGLLIGSFLNVVIIRLPIMMKKEWRQQCCELLEIEETASKQRVYNLAVPRSHCPHCQRPIAALENIPVISYLFLKGRCKGCRERISIRYPLIELITGFASACVAYYLGISAQALFALFLTWALISLSMIDFDHQLLPDCITLPFLWLGIILNMFNTFTDLRSSVLGAVFGYGSLWTVYILFKLFTGKRGMGHGDFKLLALLGTWFGWQTLPLIIVMSSAIGIIAFSSMIIFRSHDRAIPIAFGPYLAIAGWITMIWGHYIISAYLYFMF